ncbi:MAG: DUF2335 domain-containing protein [Fibromonadaceae bacterium]|jgi:uncharacterized membrane protein|nr:DUF2335 domain-containing protein [Fibromonadaceae bacterium]
MESESKDITIQSIAYYGPLPTATEFSGYEQVLPGAAGRILALAEKEAEHRRKNENKLLEESVSLSRKGQIFAFIIALVSLAIFGFSILFKQPLISIVPAVIAFTSLAAVFMGQRKPS